MDGDAIIQFALGLAAVTGIGAAIYVGFRVAMAFVRRLERRLPEPGPDADELALLRQEVAELHERLDFAERMLAQPEEPVRLEAP